MVVAFEIPPVRGNLSDGIHAVVKKSPEFGGRIDTAGKTATKPDDRNRLRIRLLEFLDPRSQRPHLEKGASQDFSSI
jgi:hypothetical protein